MIRDRGRIKWTAMMLPEHVKLLREWAKEDEWEEKSELDEQKLGEMDEVLREAQMLGKSVMIHYYTGYHYKIIIGKVRSCHSLAKTIEVIDENHAVHHIPFNQISEIERQEE